MLVALANGLASGNIASRSPMLITVIAVQTTPVSTLQTSSIDDDTQSSDGRNASATTRYRIPKPTSTHFVRIWRGHHCCRTSVAFQSSVWSRDHWSKAAPSETSTVVWAQIRCADAGCLHGCYKPLVPHPPS